MKLCASWLLVLAISPLTAPFQTFTISDVASGHAGEAFTAPTPTPASQDDSGVLVAPLEMGSGRLTLAPLPPPVISTFIATPAVASIVRSVQPARDIGGYPHPPTVLRL
jgi:hypothetical protein